jgi:hypothetical protein
LACASLWSAVSLPDLMLVWIFNHDSISLAQKLQENNKINIYRPVAEISSK